MIESRLGGLAAWQIAVVLLFAAALFMGNSRGWLQRPKPRIASYIALGFLFLFQGARLLFGTPRSAFPNGLFWGIIQLLMSLSCGWEAWAAYRRLNARK
jgi:hypothetical protein